MYARKNMFRFLRHCARKMRSGRRVLGYFLVLLRLHVAESQPLSYSTISRTRSPHLVANVKVDSSILTLDGVFPFGRILHHDSTALGIVLLNTQLHDRISPKILSPFVNLALNCPPMDVPAEAATDRVPLHRPVSRNDP